MKYSSQHDWENLTGKFALTLQLQPLSKKQQICDVKDLISYLHKTKI